MSMNQYFQDQAKLHDAARDSFRGGRPYSAANDDLNRQHADKILVLTSTYDNGAPEDYQFSQIGFFREESDACAARDRLMSERSGGDLNYLTYSVEWARVY